MGITIALTTTLLWIAAIGSVAVRLFVRKPIAAYSQEWDVWNDAECETI
jgi:hypothetical protein